MKKINSIISIIANINNSANKFITEELHKHDLSGLAPSHGDILIVLYQHEDGVAMNKITSSINKDKSTVTTLVNKLEKMQLIEKFKDDKDSRVSMVKLTKKGLETKSIVLQKISSKLLDKTYEGFSSKEKEVLTSLLERVKNNFLT